MERLIENEMENKKPTLEEVKEYFKDAKKIKDKYDIVLEYKESLVRHNAYHKNIIVQGEYNLINEGHLHSVIEKLSIKQRESFEVLKDDSILHGRFYLPSFFPGNYYSATLGYTTNPGYFIIWSNNKKRPQFFNGSV